MTCRVEVLLSYSGVDRNRSQIATIGVAAASNVVGVIVGGILGHSICTGAAVLGGKHLASHIDERMVAVLGGVLFLVFGVRGRT